MRAQSATYSYYHPIMQTYSTTGLTTRYGPQVAVHIPDSQWTFLRNQEIKYNDTNCVVHHL